MAADPLVSVVTPLYNGEKYLRQCIESVLGQTYANWEYIIVNNRSTDGSLAIADEYARRDSRIRVVTNDEFVGINHNHNIAFNLIAGESKYCKPVHADDWLFPECLAQMVAVAEAHPSVGLVGSYTLRDTQIVGTGLPYPSTVLPGATLCRLTLRGEVYVFWSPTTVLIRSDAIRAGRGAFYNAAHLHADDEACFDVLQRWDFGFVHQVLTFARTHEGSMSASKADRFNMYLPAGLEMLIRYGPACLAGDEYRSLLRRRLREYYRFLGRSIFRWREREFWQYHASMLTDLGYRFSWPRVAGSTALEALRILMYPAKAASKAITFLRERRGPSPV
jgi:glycosyltransferase involved in cell wall biosynthesis